VSDFPNDGVARKKFQRWTRGNIVVKIKEFNKTKTKDQIALPSFKDIDVSRYLSYGNLAEVMVNCDFIMPYLKETGI
jgi:hypothetical protein